MLSMGWLGIGMKWHHWHTQQQAREGAQANSGGEPGPRSFPGPVARSRHLRLPGCGRPEPGEPGEPGQPGEPSEPGEPGEPTDCCGEDSQGRGPKVSLRAFHCTSQPALALLRVCCG